ncbi:MAG: hypothetical protein Q8R16_04550 [bacterium]|nr:hypothetical protein [bacterium]
MTIEDIRARRRTIDAEIQSDARIIGDLQEEIQGFEESLKELREELRLIQQHCQHPNGVRRDPGSEVHGTNVVHCDDCGFDRPMDLL